MKSQLQMIVMVAMMLLLLGSNLVAAAGGDNDIGGGGEEEEEGPALAVNLGGAWAVEPMMCGKDSWRRLPVV